MEKNVSRQFCLAVIRHHAHTRPGSPRASVSPYNCGMRLGGTGSRLGSAGGRTGLRNHPTCGNPVALPASSPTPTCLCGE